MFSAILVTCGSLGCSFMVEHLHESGRNDAVAWILLAMWAAFILGLYTTK